MNGRLVGGVTLQKPSVEKLSEFSALRHIVARDVSLDIWPQPAPPLDGTPVDCLIQGIHSPADLHHVKEFRLLGGSVAIIAVLDPRQKGLAVAALKHGADAIHWIGHDRHLLISQLHALDRIIGDRRGVDERLQRASRKVTDLQQSFKSIDADLVEASKLQNALIRDRNKSFDGGALSFLYRPRARVGGDLVGYYSASRHSIGFFAMDVSGHGITAALMTARIASYLTDGAMDQNMALEQIGGKYVTRKPSQVLARLNEVIMDELDTEHFVTFLLATLNLETGQLLFSQAGHPNPLVQRGDGTVQFLGDGGLPVGLFPGAEYEDRMLQLNPGDRFLMYSDGVTECMKGDRGEGFGKRKLAEIMVSNSVETGAKMMELISWSLSKYYGEDRLADDVSAALFEYHGNPKE